MKKGLFLTFLEKRCISSHLAAVAGQLGCRVEVLLSPYSLVIARGACEDNNTGNTFYIQR